MRTAKQSRFTGVCPRNQCGLRWERLNTVIRSASAASTGVLPAVSSISSYAPIRWYSGPPSTREKHNDSEQFARRAGPVLRRRRARGNSESTSEGGQLEDKIAPPRHVDVELARHKVDPVAMITHGPRSDPQDGSFRRRGLRGATCGRLTEWPDCQGWCNRATLLRVRSLGVIRARKRQAALRGRGRRFESSNVGHEAFILTRG